MHGQRLPNILYFHGIQRIQGDVKHSGYPPFFVDLCFQAPHMAALVVKVGELLKQSPN